MLLCACQYCFPWSKYRRFLVKEKICDAAQVLFAFGWDERTNTYNGFISAAELVYVRTGGRSRGQVRIRVGAVSAMAGQCSLNPAGPSPAPLSIPFCHCLPRSLNCHLGLCNNKEGPKMPILAVSFSVSQEHTQSPLLQSRLPRMRVPVAE